MLVANHSFGWDSILPMAAVWRQLDRPVWVLGEHAWWKVPFLRRLAAAVGTVDGTPTNADRLLAGEELVLVLPGGLREAVKPRELRYRLLWGNRYGFIRAAIRNQAPIVPLASIGADDLFDFVGNAYRRGEVWLRRGGIPVPLPSRILPIPHFVKLAFLFGAPIPPRAARRSQRPRRRAPRTTRGGGGVARAHRERTRPSGGDRSPLATVAGLASILFVLCRGSPCRLVVRIMSEIERIPMSRPLFSRTGRQRTWCLLMSSCAKSEPLLPSARAECGPGCRAGDGDL